MCWQSSQFPSSTWWWEYYSPVTPHCWVCHMLQSKPHQDWPELKMHIICSAPRENPVAQIWKLTWDRRPDCGSIYAYSPACVYAAARSRLSAPDAPGPPTHVWPWVHERVPSFCRVQSPAELEGKKTELHTKFGSKFKPRHASAAAS